MAPKETQDGVRAYLVSKALAEKAACDFVEKEKPKFSIATLNPPLVYGPIAHAVDSMSSLNTSSADLYRLFNGSLQEVPDAGFWAAVDVRDGKPLQLDKRKRFVLTSFTVALAHLRAYTSPAAANQRYLLSGSTFNYQMATDIIRKHFPELRSSTPEAKVKQLSPPDVYQLDSTKATKDLGIDFIPLEDTVIDTVRSLRALEERFA